MNGVVEVRWCDECRLEQPFELPPCEDGHGDDCPDLACVECGAAVVVGIVDPAPAPVVLRSAA